MQGVSNQNTGMLANRRLRQEELLGQAIASQRAYRTNAINSIGSDLTTAGTYGLMSEGGFKGRPSYRSTLNRVKFTPPTDYVDSDLTGLE
jgi:hypothetical protein